MNNKQLFIMKALLLILLMSLVLAQSNRNYPMFKQCNQKWANQQLGTSTRTICNAGCLLSSSSMALYAVGNIDINPSTLNQWLNANGGYVQTNLYVWASVNKLGVTFQGFISNSNIKSKLDQGYIVILNVHNGGHWVLATGYSGDNILVNDPGYSVSSYSLSEIVDGNTGIYSINRLPNFINNWIFRITEAIFGKEDPQFPPVQVTHENGNIRQY